MGAALIYVSVEYPRISQIMFLEMPVFIAHAWPWVRVGPGLAMPLVSGWERVKSKTQTGNFGISKLHNFGNNCFLAIFPNFNIHCNLELEVFETPSIIWKPNTSCPHHTVHCTVLHLSHGL